MTASASRAVVLVSMLSLTNVGVAAAPKGRYAIDEARGTVRDSSTKLLWQRDGSFSAQTPAAARTHCAGLALGGYDSGWRLPSRAELLSLIDASTFAPAVDEAAFPRTKSGWYWSTTPPASGRDDAWIVNFRDGACDYDHFDAVPPFGVRCVR